jgi:hypothetical protein
VFEEVTENYGLIAFKSVIFKCQSNLNYEIAKYMDVCVRHVKYMGVCVRHVDLNYLFDWWETHEEEFRRILLVTIN